MRVLTGCGVIARVLPDSIAWELGIQPGDQIITVNGQVVKDIVDLSFAFADDHVELLIKKVNDEQEILEIEKEYDEDIGLEFESAVFDGVRCCANQCIFCFVDQMAPNMRKSLYVKDDDYRLSFLYGNFITLTNLVPQDIDRIRRFHLSPLYVSVHTTNGSLRQKMLGNKNADKILRQLKELIDYGIEFHTQIVLCPGINDGEQLKQTIDDLYKLHPNILSTAVVPVGLSRYRENCHHLQGFEPAEAAQVVEMITDMQKKYRQEAGKSFAYLADEFYLAANLLIPDTVMYDDFPQLENGIGMVRNFLDEWERSSSAANFEYKQPHYIDVICGTSAEKILQPLLSKLKIPNLMIRIVPVVNCFFGSTITVTGLLTGQDILHTLQSLTGPRTGVIIPGVALRKGEIVFLDNTTPDQLAQQLDVSVRIAYNAQDLRQLLSAWQP
ncbi:MAG: DUF512 domain-containing protein [Veillonellales bacterium]